jgi:hypothetical protein
MTVDDRLVVLVSVWLMDASGVVTADSPVTLAFAATVQVYFMFAGTMSPPPVVGVTVNVSPEQMGVADLLPITTVTGGSTITVSKKGVPGQIPLLGVTLYTTVCCTLLVLIKPEELVVPPKNC